MEFKSKHLAFLIILCILFSITTVSASDNQADLINANNNDYQSDIDLNQYSDVNNQNSDFEGDVVSESSSNQVLYDWADNSNVGSDVADVGSNDDYQDINSNQESESESGSDNLGDDSQEDYKSFDELYRDMMASDGTFNMEHNYKYMESDEIDDFDIGFEEFVINGNNKIIDGSKCGFSFDISNSEGNVIINDLTFINFSNSILKVYGKLTLNNVNFTGNDNLKDEMVSVRLHAQLIVNNCDFKSNINSSAIYASASTVYVYNSNISGNGSAASAIYHDRGQLFIENSSFDGFSSNIGGIINYKGDHFSIKNSRFMNSFADFNGGAIIAKYFPLGDEFDSVYTISDDMLIENCSFSNVSSAHNGGAIYLDLDSGSKYIPQGLNIIGSNFTDSSSDFGGAIAIMGGNLSIADSIFKNCSANSLGGAIYAAWINLTINDSLFSNNTAKLNASAVYFDYGKLVIDNSNFTGNQVNGPSTDLANTIFANDVDADIENSVFDNGQIAVYANFASNSNIKDITSSDLILMDNKDYVVSVENRGIKLNLTNNSLVVDELPVKFDARDWGWASPLKEQGDNFACWAFASAGALEGSLLKATGVLYNISENNIQNLQLRYYLYGDKRNNGTGFAYSALGHALSWFGVVMSEDDPYNERGMISKVVETENRIHLQDAKFIFGGREDTVELLKEAILKYGAVSIQFDVSTFDYNYYDTENQPTHFVALIGWDDTIPAEKFGSDWDPDAPIPPGPGGFIIKDSEGLNVGDNGYDYLSYYDKSLLAKDFYAIIPQYAAVAYIFENTIDYHVNYQTDLTGLAGFDADYAYYSNEFTSKYSELIGAVGTYFNESGINYSFDVFVNGKKVLTQTGVSEFAGFRTIKLNKYIPIKAGETFKVVFKNNAVPFQAFSRQHYVPGMSMVSADGSNWSDMSILDRTVCLKVYTLADDTKVINNKDIAVDYGSGSYFSVKVVTSDGHAVGAGAVVKFTINGKTTTAKTDSNGIAKIKITQVPKKYAITTACNGKTYKNNVTVKLNLKKCKVTANKNIKVDYTGGSYFKVKVVSNDGKVAASGASVKFTINGKTTTVKTDKKGIAKIKITQVPKKYTIKTVFNGKTYKNTVTVRHVVSSSKGTVKKTANKFALKAKLKINGKLIKGKAIKFKFNGKTYSAKTSKKGIAQKTFKKSFIKKLKKGKTYAVQVTYLKDTIKTSLKVK